MIMILDKVHHKRILIKMLSDIFTDHKLGPFLGFKGGTAALLFYGLSRFSVDLDFDLLEISEQNQIYENIISILKKYGTLKKGRLSTNSLFFSLSYDNKIDSGHNIKVEINKRFFGSHYELKEYLGIPMKVMVRADMSAHKLVAMYERMGEANRDIYDVWFFFSNFWPINKNIVEQRSQLSYKDFLNKCIQALEILSDQGILSGIGNLLDDKQKKWAKTKLRTETIFLLKLALSEEK